MKFYCKPTLTLFLLLYVAIQSAQAQDTLRITLQDAVRIALSDNPTIKVAGQEILLKKEGHSCISPWQYNHVIQRLWTL